jgi:3-oxoacyl-[acyl-carrier protein] reductase
MKLKNEVALITGSSSGIGRAVALLFAQEGAKVVVNCRNNTKGGKQTADEIKKSGGDAFLVQADVSDEKSVEKLFSTINKKYGSITILVNNAGSTEPKTFFKTSKKHWIDQMNDNFIGTVLCSQFAAKEMKKRKIGKIINTSSIRGINLAGREGLIAYSAAKAAVNNFTKTLAKELAPDIQVNAVAPGFVWTPNYEKFSKELQQTLISGTYLGRFIQPEEIAQAYLFLAQSAVTTGEILTVDGGFTLKKG